MENNTINELQKKIHQTAKDHGWWNDDRDIGTILMLIVTEVAEAMEAHRENKQSSENIPQFSGVEEELADIIIRVLDFAGHKGYDMEKILQAKMEYNDTRPYRHGGKIA
jgi:NTP pyrophosphatase (non-canonical NTP hydrolase)